MSETEHSPVADPPNGAQPVSNDPPVQEANGQASRSVDEASRPADEASRPADEASRPADEASRPADEASRLADEASRPADEASRPADEAPGPKRRRKRRRRRKTSLGNDPHASTNASSSATPPSTGSVDAPTTTDAQPAASTPTESVPPAPSEKELARAAQTLAFLHTHSTELGLDDVAPRAPVSNTEGADAPAESASRAIWEVERSLGRALSGDGFRKASALRRAELLDAALEISPTPSVLLARLQNDRAVDSVGSVIDTSSPTPVDGSSDAAVTAESPRPPTAPTSNDAVGEANEGATAPEHGVRAPAVTSASSPVSDRETGDARPSKDGAASTRYVATLELLRRIESEPGNVEQLLELLDELAQTEPRARYVEWLLAMIENRELKRTLEQATPRLPPPWRAASAHAKILAAVVVRGQTNQWGARQLHAALRALLRSGAAGVLSRPVSMRQRLATLALRLRLKDHETQVVLRLLESLDGHPCAEALSLEHARDLLAAQQYARAATELETLATRSSHPLISQMRKALTGPRFGSVALLKSRAKAPLSNTYPLRAGAWLSQQMDVWLRLGDAEHAAAFAQHVDVHRRGEIPGVTPIVEHGFTKGNRPYIAYLKQGENAHFALTPAHGLGREDALDAARQLLQLGYGLARCGFVLPDAELGRLERDPSGRLWLVETWDSRIEPLDVAQEASLSLLRRWLQQLLLRSQLFSVSSEIEDTLKHAADFATVRATLDVLNRTRRWEG